MNYIIFIILLVQFIGKTTGSENSKNDVSTLSDGGNGDSNRIIGGEETKAHAWPWQVSIQFRISGTDVSIQCGGSLISELWILTAGHCFFDSERDPTTMLKAECGTVTLGLHYAVNLERNDDYYQTRQVKVMILHKRFRLKNWFPEYDIGLVKMLSKATFSRAVRKIKLAEEGENLEAGTPVIVTGWGVTKRYAFDISASYGGGSCRVTGEKLQILETINNICGQWQLRSGSVNFYADGLQQVQTKILDQNECLEKNNVAFDLGDNVLCAGEELGDKDSCYGDSGGPLMAKRGGEWVLYGIVSYGKGGCANKDFPGVYTNVSTFRDWINNHIH